MTSADNEMSSKRPSRVSPVGGVADGQGCAGAARGQGAALPDAGTSVLAYRELGWPVTHRGERVSLNLDADLDAVAVVIPVVLAARVAEILTERHCRPAVLFHPALPGHRVIVAGERFGVPLSWPTGVHRVTGTMLLPPTVTAHGPVRWVRPPRPRTLQLCREFDVCAALCAASREPPPSSPSHF